jgi:hypothetical protein
MEKTKKMEKTIKKKKKKKRGGKDTVKSRARPHKNNEGKNRIKTHTKNMKVPNEGYDFI